MGRYHSLSQRCQVAMNVWIEWPACGWPAAANSNSTAVTPQTARATRVASQSSAARRAIAHQARGWGGLGAWANPAARRGGQRSAGRIRSPMTSAIGAKLHTAGIHSLSPRFRPQSSLTLPGASAHLLQEICRAVEVRDEVFLTPIAGVTRPYAVLQWGHHAKMTGRET